jgi:hypothetical protein
LLRSLSSFLPSLYSFIHSFISFIPFIPSPISSLTTVQQTFTHTHTYTHIYIHTNIHTHKHTHTQTYILTNIHTHKHTPQTDETSVNLVTGGWSTAFDYLASKTYPQNPIESDLQAGELAEVVAQYETTLKADWMRCVYAYDGSVTTPCAIRVE